MKGATDDSELTDHFEKRSVFIHSALTGSRLVVPGAPIDFTMLGWLTSICSYVTGKCRSAEKGKPAPRVRTRGLYNTRLIPSVHDLLTQEHAKDLEHRLKTVRGAAWFWNEEKLPD